MSSDSSAISSSSSSNAGGGESTIFPRWLRVIYNVYERGIFYIENPEYGLQSTHEARTIKLVMICLFVYIAFRVSYAISWLNTKRQEAARLRRVHEDGMISYTLLPSSVVVDDDEGANNKRGDTELKHVKSASNMSHLSERVIVSCHKNKSRQKNIPVTTKARMDVGVPSIVEAYTDSTDTSTSEEHSLAMPVAVGMKATEDQAHVMYEKGVDTKERVDSGNVVKKKKDDTADAKDPEFSPDVLSTNEEDEDEDDNDSDDSDDSDLNVEVSGSARVTNVRDNNTHIVIDLRSSGNRELDKLKRDAALYFDACDRISTRKRREIIEALPVVPNADAQRMLRKRKHVAYTEVEQSSDIGGGITTKDANADRSEQPAAKRKTAGSIEQANTETVPLTSTNAKSVMHVGDTTSQGHQQQQQHYHGKRGFTALADCSTSAVTDPSMQEPASKKQEML
jgi:hypothetical protein